MKCDYRTEYYYGMNWFNEPALYLHVLSAHLTVFATFLRCIAYCLKKNKNDLYP